MEDFIVTFGGARKRHHLSFDCLSASNSIILLCMDQESDSVGDNLIISFTQYYLGVVL